jgi:GTP-binding protein Era
LLFYLCTIFMKSGFVSIFGRPNAGKSTLLNLLMGEKLAIVSRKVQTTRHRIKGILSGKDYQVVFSDTPGIIEPRYKLHEKMMKAVKSALEDADAVLLLVDIRDDWKVCDEIFSGFQLNAPAIVVLNKTDLTDTGTIKEAELFFSSRPYCKKCIPVSALYGAGKEELLQAVVECLPEGVPFYQTDELSDLSTRFFVAELIREKIYDLYEEEIPYHTTVLVTDYKEKESLVKISADIIVQRESQKGIILGQNGSMIKKLGTAARIDIEKFIGQKVFLELFVKVRPKWRDSELMLKEYGY